MDKLKMETPDMAAENVEKNCGALFPSAVTEMRGEDGSIKKGVNFEMLKQLLSPDVVEDGDERYEFTWVGKKQAVAEAARPTTKTLRPVKGDSRNSGHHRKPVHRGRQPGSAENPAGELPGQDQDDLY